MRAIRVAAIVSAGSFVAFLVGYVVAGIWGAEAAGGTNWVDQTFGLLVFLGGAVAMLALPLLFVLMLIEAGRSMRHHHPH